MLGCRKKCITYFHDEVNLPAYPAAMGLWDEVGSPRSLGKVAAKLAATSSPGVSAAAVSPGRSATAAARPFLVASRVRDHAPRGKASVAAVLGAFSGAVSHSDKLLTNKK